jgi:acetyltransferase-like isoleucine patch superfamily enzyme
MIEPLKKYLQMKMGLGKLLVKIHIWLDCFLFLVRGKFLGFNNAIAMFRTIDKNSVIPILLRNGATIGKNCDIESPLLFHNCNNFSKLIVGDNCHIGKNCFFDLKDTVIIESNVVISMQCTIITHFDLSKSSLAAKFPIKQQPTILRANCYLGANSTILMGVIIGESTVVAAGSVVNKNTDPFTMVGGVPAKFIKTIN